MFICPPLQGALANPTSRRNGETEMELHLKKKMQKPAAVSTDPKFLRRDRSDLENTFNVKAVI